LRETGISVKSFTSTVSKTLNLSGTGSESSTSPRPCP
jgi:hypothetical protein